MIHRILTDVANAQWEIPDPGTGKPIVIDRTCIVPITTGASGETNTLADPTKSGVIAVLICVVFGGGNRVVTAATAVNQTGNNTLTFGAARDCIVLMSVPLGSGYVWETISLADSTVALSTV